MPTNMTAKASVQKTTRQPVDGGATAKDGEVAGAPLVAAAAAEATAKVAAMMEERMFVAQKSSEHLRTGENKAAGSKRSELCEYKCSSKHFQLEEYERGCRLDTAPERLFVKESRRQLLSTHNTHNHSKDHPPGEVYSSLNTALTHTCALETNPKSRMNKD
ncbi:Hypothetical predicted protein [Xyrichtys novacula]|uniref:Uncharacterized protein n=1 Tax=Xyrichtys novacula TaxID=13765 RepID=A0AAV1HBA3_XYRNO|nr:Hypothetical predicted protein [Xyrichtys novacula]